jgi:tetratricopeptide (TPR) repeat protein
MMATSEPSIRARIGFVLGRFRRLPATFWLVLATIFGIADFLTWSALAGVAREDRPKLTLGLVALALIATLVAVLRSPTSDERMVRARALQRTAREAYKAASYADAEGLLLRAMDLDPDSPGGWGLLGRVLLRLGKYEQAIPALTKAIELTQVNRGLYLHNRGLAHAMLGHYGRALDDLDESIQEKPDRPITLRWRALVWLYLGRYDNALQDINAALKLKPLYLCGHATKAVVLSHLGQDEAAEKELSRCGRLRPQDADDFYCLALARSQLQRESPNHVYQALRIAIERDAKYAARARIEPLFDQLRQENGFWDLIEQPPQSDRNGATNA